MREAGLEVVDDEAGNLRPRGAARVWAGSHLDTVPNGGRFDGALGVVAGDRGGGALPERRRSPSSRSARRPDRWAAAAVPSGRSVRRAAHRAGAVLERAGRAARRRDRDRGQARGHVSSRARRPRGHDADGRARRRARRGGAHSSSMSSGLLRATAPSRPSASWRSSQRRGRRARARHGLGRRAGAGGPGSWTGSWRRSARADVAAGAGGDERRALRDAARVCYRTRRGSSRAPGHDAMVLAAAGVPTAMLFVRSLNGGVSPRRTSSSSAEDIALAVDALTGALGESSAPDAQQICGSVGRSRRRR